jgi:aminoglycoside 6-adenylyltransferase
MDPISLTYEQIINRFCTWAQSQDDIRAAFIVGSQVRTDRPADQWSDLDIVVISSDPDRYLSDESWLVNIGPFWFSFVEQQAVGSELERRVLFEGCRDVDFALLPAGMIEEMLLKGLPPEIAAIFRRGYRFILDKDGIQKRLDIITFAEPPYQPPTQEEFLNRCKHYWYHTVWLMKKLHRGEIWMAYVCLNNYMSWHLLKMLEWHAHTIHGGHYDTWHNGRFVEKWADPQAVARLPQAFSHYDPADIQRALQEQILFFRRIAQETAECLHYSYPIEADRYATEWIKANPVS